MSFCYAHAFSGLYCRTRSETRPLKNWMKVEADAQRGTQTHKTAQEPAEQGAEGVGEDAAAEVLEVRVVPQTQREVIVGRNVEVSVW